jgi:protein ImuA
VPEPASLHAALWRASQLGHGRRAVTPSGFEALDRQLPGQGWPHGELTELLLPQPGIGELRLLAPALAAIGGSAGGDGVGDGFGDREGGAASAEGPRCIMLFAPPAALSAWALAQQGLSSRHWLVVQARSGAPRTPSGLLPLLPSADLLWALEQALRSGQVGAVLAWLPVGLRADALRRLQLAAQAHDGPVFLFREAQARQRPSAAPLRLAVQPAGVDGLSLRLLKRRGPPLAEPLRLALPSVLTPQQQARALTLQAVAQAGRTARAVRAAPATPTGRTVLPSTRP